MKKLIFFTALLLLAGAPMLSAQEKNPNASVPLEVFKELPTLRCLGVRWPLLGDANKNAQISLSYRKVGTEKWKVGYPLFRSYPDPHPDNPTPFSRVEGGWMFAGSVLDLTPETEYEVKLNLKDPDGGEAERTVKMKTIGEPKQPEGMRERHVIPGTGGGTGTAEDPIKGLDAANAAAEPGDLFLLHKGTYIKGNCKDNCWNLTVSGTPGKPIIFRAAGDGEAILDGAGLNKPNPRLVSAELTSHIWFEGLTLRGKHYQIVGHWASNWVMRRNFFDCKLGTGFESHNGDYDASRHHFISDNVFIGPTKWPRTKGIESFAGVAITGGGHVVCHNLFSNLGDAVHGRMDAELSASDFYNNEIHICTDDGIETDYADLNVRVFDNRIVNVAHGITAQPARGGPIYIYRNVIYNATYTHFKLHNQTTGPLLFHNTCIREGAPMVISNAGETVTNAWSINNLYIGTKGTAFSSVGRMRPSCVYENDGFGGYTGPFIGAWNKTRWATMADAKKAGVIYHKYGAHKVNPDTLFASGLKAPNPPSTIYPNKDIDVRLKEGSDAIDKGIVLPNFNDGFKGKAPDLGAFELGAELPLYGPRPIKAPTNPPKVIKTPGKKPQPLAAPKVDPDQFKTLPLESPAPIKAFESFPRMKDKDWKSAGKGLTEFRFGTYEAARGRLETAVWAYMGYTEKGLYLLYVNSEPQPVMLIANYRDPKKDHDKGVWADDCIELFFVTDPEKAPDSYYQVIVNSKGVAMDAKMKKGKTIDKNWNANLDIKITTIAKGVADVPGYWIAEMLIPWSDLGGKPEDGTIWKINLARDRMIAGGEEFTWAPVGGSYHQPAKFKPVVFRKK